MRPFIIILAFFCCGVLSAQSSNYKRIAIDIETRQDILNIGALGIAMDHAYVNADKKLVHDFHPSDIQKIEAAGYSYSILVEDLSPFYAAQCNHDHSTHMPLITEDCFNDIEGVVSPENFQLGDMGGYLTYEEALDELDKMASLYPNLISTKAVVNDQLTHEGRPMHWVRISDNPNVDEDEPEVLYNALTHAREPMGLMQMVFYMWYLLENYDTNEEVKFLVDETAMYFIPIVNPDGYVYNQLIQPDGGGLWRKNRRLNDDGTYGVDLNRNFGYAWGVDDQGSSPNPESQIYRGPEANSEPETQMLQHFCESRAFLFALNYHCYGNLLIMPWGFSSSPTGEGETFEIFAEALTKENNYFAGTPLETVGYTANGVVDDWMYGEETTKDPIYSMTPEVGPGGFGFWPPSSSIEDLSKTVLRQNLNLASLPHNFGITALNYDATIDSNDGQIFYDLKKYGLADGTFEFTLDALTTNVSVPDPIVNLNPTFGETESGSFYFIVGPDVAQGTVLEFELKIDNGHYILTLPVAIQYLDGEPLEEELLFEGNTSLGVWDQNDTWGLETTDYYSAPFSFGDSPATDYSSNTSSMLISDPILIGEDLTNIKLEFYTKWEIEQGYDYVQIQAADAENNFLEALCGIYTTEGAGGFQPANEPVYQGTQDEWVFEQIDLSEYVGQEIRIRFLLASDNFVEYDGFYFDDLEITGTLDNTTNTSKEIPLNDFVQLSPNPGTSALNISFKDSDFRDLKIYDNQGKLMFEKYKSQNGLSVDTASWSSGVYYLQLNKADGKTQMLKWIKQ